METVILATDGLCRGDPGPGGWAALIRYSNKKEKLIKGSVEYTTNNRMKLKALLEGLKAIEEPSHIVLKIDSQYVMNVIAKKWLDKWIRSKWRRVDGVPIANKDLWLEILEFINKHRITWQWIRTYSDDKDNDFVAKTARMQYICI